MGNNTQNAALVAFLNDHLNEILDWLQTHSTNVAQIETLDYDSSLIVGILGTYESGGVQKVVNITPQTVVQALSGIQSELIALCQAATTNAQTQGNYARTQAEAAQQAAQLIEDSIDELTQLQEDAAAAVEQVEALVDRSDFLIAAIEDAYEQSQQTLQTVQQALDAISGKDAQVDTVISQAQQVVTNHTALLAEMRDKITIITNTKAEMDAARLQAQTATTNADAATARANTAAANAESATEATLEAKNSLVAAATAASTAARDADNARTRANTAATNADRAAENANTAAAAANNSVLTNNTAAANANAAAVAASTAAGNADASAAAATSAATSATNAATTAREVASQAQELVDALEETSTQLNAALAAAQARLAEIGEDKEEVEQMIQDGQQAVADCQTAQQGCTDAIQDVQDAIDDLTDVVANMEQARLDAVAAASEARAAAALAIEASENNSGNTLNMAVIAPLQSGYYTLETAIRAVPAKFRAPLRCITFTTAEGAVTKQFTGTTVASWEDAAAWADFGGGGKIKAIQFNGQELEPTGDGTVSINIDTIEVDSSLSGESTNPVANNAVCAAIDELRNPQFNSDVDSDDEGSTVTLTTQTGQQVAQFRVQGGGGSGGGSAATSKIVISASVSRAKVKEGGSALLTWYYNHVNSDNEPDGLAGDITVTVKRGSVTLYEQTMSSVAPSAAAHTIQLDAWLKEAGTVGVYIRAAANDNGTPQAKSVYVPITVVSLNLSLTNVSSIMGHIASGGYANGETVSIDYAVKGSGTKVVNMYVDGSETPVTQTVTKAGTTNGSFTLQASSLSAGRHVIQLVAENDDLLSESIYIDILKAGSTAPFIGLYFTTDDGTIFSSDYLTPTIKAMQYESSSYQYIVYDPRTTPASLNEYQNGTLVRTYAAARALQTYSTRYATSGIVNEQFVCGQTAYSFLVNVAESSINISKATTGLVLELLAAGRSNDEANPATWENNGITTEFTGFDWKSSGWNGDALIEKNGAKTVVNIKPFDESADPASTGKTIEMELKLSNIIDYNANIISCIHNGKGFRITGSKASMLTGSSVQYTDENGDQQERVVGVEKVMASDIDLKLAFVIGKRSEYRLMELYVNGKREKADIYNTTDNFVQDVPQGITIDSAAADVELRSIRVYNRALSDDEIVDNYIVDRKTSEEMLECYENNDILNDDGDVDINKLLAKGKAVVRIIRQGGLDEVNSTNNKKTDFLADVIFYSPFGSEWDFKIEGCYIRIQGTSSTKYPRKNYRIYLLKPGSAKFYRRNANGEWYLVVDFTGWPNSPGDKPAPLICLKADYSDSSMCLNTGGARLFDWMMRELGLLTPPQEHDEAVRQAINGFPCDVFSSESEDGTIEYYGQYNFNNDKGKSGIVFGHTDVDGFDTTNSLALEFLNNSNEVALFQTAGSVQSNELAAQMAAKFDDGLEFNHPEDYKWATIDNAVPGAQNALLRLFGWVHDCIQECVTNNGLNLATTDYKDISKFVCPKFRSELDDYFELDHLLTYYLWTDYFMSVDQRVKNMLLRTWDLRKWYITYYDGDTALGKRNDSFLAYLYTLTRDTFDTDKNKYAFEGHNSWLWCLVLANYADELCECAKAMRNVLTNAKVLEMFNTKQMGNWCERAYNKSGKFKYIDPATMGVREIRNGVVMEGVTYPFIYALDGSNYSHRVNTILSRFALLDAQYGCDSFKDDNVEMYLSRADGDATGIIRVTANNIYCFDWNTKNGSHSDVKRAEAGETVSLEFTGAITVNDPVDLYGASQMAKLDLRGVATSIQNGINLNKAKVLQEIDASSQTVCTQAWWFNFEQCGKIKKIDCTNQQGVKTGTSSSTEFNVSNQAKLEILRIGGTAVQSVELAEGAPLNDCILPGTLKVLKLRYLPVLQMSGLTIQGYGSIETFIFSACPKLDWRELLARCTNVTRIRVEGINMQDDGSFLEQYKRYKGMDAEGNAVPECRFEGNVYLTSYIEDSLYEEYRAAYPELNIHQPEYTTIEFDDSVSDDANVSNLDNATGYKFGNTYVPSGHIQRILNLRHRVLAKVTAQGEMTYFPLHDSNSNFYADAENINGCSPARLDSTEGDVMMFEPHYWFKGVNDFLNNKKYSCYSTKEEMPTRPEAMVITLENIKALEHYRKNYKVMTGRETISASYSSDSAYSVCRVIVYGYRRVRFPSVPGSGLMGAVFTDSEGAVLSSVVVPTLTSKFNAGMYLVADVPTGAASLYFTIRNTAPFDCVVLSNSENILDMEPDWVEHEECLTAVFKSSVVSQGLRSCITGGTSLANTSWTDFHYYSNQRGMQQIDYEMSRDIANLFYAKYGRRDSQGQCGAGSHTNTRTTGATAILGMTDTVNTDGVTVGGTEGNGVAFYKSKDSDGQETFVRIDCTNCLGYEDVYGHKTECMDNVSVPNGSNPSGEWHITMPDGTLRKVQGVTSSDFWITNVVHGKYMDIIPAGNYSGSQNTYYCDKTYFASSSSRVVYRGHNYAYASGGVANSNASTDASYSSATLGSRLAFRGRIVKAESVATYKSLSEVS